MINKDIKKYFAVKKIPLQDIIRLFKREGIENYVIAKREKFENVLKELETYKKIVEQLASDLRICYAQYEPCEMEIRIKKECSKYKNCVECIIENARNEVEKNEKE